MTNIFNPSDEQPSAHPVEDRLERSRISVLNIIILYSIIVMSFFTIYSYSNGNYLITALDVVTGVVLVSIYIYLKKTSNFCFSSHVVVNLLGLHYLYLVYSGGMHQMGYIWSFLFPIGVIFFLGKKHGIIYSLSFLLAASILLFSTSAYNSFGLTFHFRYIGIYFTFTIISYAFEHIRARLNEDLLNKNLLLENKIAELKEKDAALTKEKEKAEKAEKFKTEFLAQMSHEIRTPINTILNYTSLLENELKEQLPEELQHSFTSINNASNRLIRTIDLILDSSAIESGAHEIRIQKLDLSNDIIFPVIIEFEQAARKKNVLIKYENEPRCNCFINADKYTITQTLTNLVHNAIKYTKQGEVIVRCTKNNGSIKLKIIDTGIGISEEYLPNLFKKFSQETQGYTRSYEGNGLGLALVKKYCEINKVGISVESIKDKGTTFTLKFKPQQK